MRPLPDVKQRRTGNAPPGTLYTPSSLERDVHMSQQYSSICFVFLNARCILGTGRFTGSSSLTSLQSAIHEHKHACGVCCMHGQVLCKVKQASYFVA